MDSEQVSPESLGQTPGAQRQRQRAVRNSRGFVGEKIQHPMTHPWALIWFTYMNAWFFNGKLVGRYINIQSSHGCVMGVVFFVCLVFRPSVSIVGHVDIIERPWNLNSVHLVGGWASTRLKKYAQSSNWIICPGENLKNIWKPPPTGSHDWKPQNRFSEFVDYQIAKDMKLAILWANLQPANPLVQKW